MNNNNNQNQSNNNNPNNIPLNFPALMDIEQIMEFNQNQQLEQYLSFYSLVEFQNRQQLRINNFSRNNHLPEDDFMHHILQLQRDRDSSSPRMLEYNQQNLRHKNTHLEKYMKKRENPIQNDELNKNEPYIKVTVQRNINYPNNNHSNEYFINQHGLVGSQKNANSEDILIGRAHRTDVIPNDIMLPEDRIISRIHCKIVSKNYFRKNQKIKYLYKYAIENLKNFKGIRLPTNALKLISQFLECPRYAYVQDLGSLCGTHLKILKNEPTLIKYDQKYSIGSDTVFVITLSESYKKNGLELDDQFFKLLRKLNTLKQKHDLHFSDQTIQQRYENIQLNDEELEEMKNQNNDKHQELFTKLKEYKIPLLGIRFNGSGIDSNKVFYLFVGLENQDTKEFQIGRGQDNQVKINSNTISRKQSRFKYSQQLKSWVIFDGAKDRDSANGTWVSLSTQQQADKKSESDMVILRNNSEIKISEFILKIELFSGKKQSNINQELLNKLKVSYE